MTSQIFANIYFHEFDRFIKYYLRPQAYLRYGDDFIMIAPNQKQILQFRKKSIYFLRNKLHLRINGKNDTITKIKYGARFLGVDIFPKGRRLNKRSWRRIEQRLNSRNIASYSGLVREHTNKKRLREFNWFLLNR